MRILFTRLQYQRQFTDGVITDERLNYVRGEREGGVLLRSCNERKIKTQ